MPATSPQWYRPIIDLDLGRTYQYGYRVRRATVTYHDPVPAYDLLGARQRAGLSQVALAGLIGTSRTSVRRYETGQAPCPEVMRTRWRAACARRTRRRTAA